MGCGSSKHVEQPQEGSLVSPLASAQSRYITERSLDADYIVDEKRVLGKGMSGPVKLAVGRCDGCKYAVKSFSKQSFSARELKAMRNEASIFLSLDHPHIARLEAVYETEEALHFVMEYLEGGELFKQVKGAKGFSEAKAMKATRQILLAVAYLHDRGVAHRDLKLENFVYERSDSDDLKLIDFGLSKFVREGEKMSEVCGTTAYLAPEVLHKSYTKQADTWALGVVVYMMLTERMLFSGSKAEVFSKIRRGKFEFNSRFDRLSDSAKDFVMSLLTMNPAARLTPRQALEHRWLRRGREENSQARADPKLLSSFRRFARISPCQQKVFSLLTWSVSAEEQAALRQQFLAMDLESTGTISLQAFKKVLADKLESTEEAVALFKGLDVDGNDKIEYSEFLAAAITGNSKLQDTALKRAFVHLDRNGDGTVSLAELTGLLGDSCSTAEIEKLLDEADQSGDGKLCLEDFSAYVRGVETVMDLVQH